MSKLLTGLVCVSLVLVIGCGYSDSEGEAVEEVLAALNLECPITGEPVAADATVDFQDQTIGFCCAKCIKDFRGRDEADKLAVLADAGIELPR